MDNLTSREAVRLVIWDLDETFWRGTLSEGGIREYVRDHHDIVVELARRGILSSICSKNDRDTVEQVLRERGLWDYFVFPSINWQPKGPRLAALVEQIGLRPPTILFIDDNHGSRAEAAAAVPGLQIADENCIAGLLTSPLLKGKDDAALSRLKQYKLLEARKRDEQQAGGANDEFLRASDIRVEFEYDVAKHIDRAVELINRTNQLNYTKRRLPEEPAAARAALLEQLRAFWVQAALIRVVDRYGDYGYCGFYLRSNGQGAGAGELMHYCFSCRTLGMFVEQWVFEHLGRPKLEVAGAVLTDLSQPRDIDWIRLNDAAEPTGRNARPIPEVRLRGGCEVDALSHYFAGRATTCTREASINRGPFFIIKDYLHHLAIPGGPPLDDDFLAMAESCGFTREDFDSQLLAPCPPGCLIVYSGWNDTRESYRHNKTGRLFSPGLTRIPLNALPRAQKRIDRRLAENDLTDDDRDRLRKAIAALRQNATFVGRPKREEVTRQLANLFAATPPGSKVAALAVDEFGKKPGGRPEYRRFAANYNRWLRAVAARYGVEVFAIADYLRSEDERISSGHFDRIVYFRLASAIIDWATREADAAHAAPSTRPATAHNPGRLQRLWRLLGPRKMAEFPPR